MCGFPQEAFEMTIRPKPPKQSVKRDPIWLESCFVLDSGKSCYLCYSRIILREGNIPDH